MTPYRKGSRLHFVLLDIEQQAQLHATCGRGSCVLIESVLQGQTETSPCLE